MNATVLLTGATGFIGRWLLRDLTARGFRVLALLRRPEHQLAELRQWLQTHEGDPARVEAVAGDMSQPRWGLTPDDWARLSRVDVIYHLATRFVWDLAPEQARRDNVASLQPLLELVDANSGLQRLVWVGGYMVGNPDLLPALRQLAAGDWQPVYRRLGAYEGSKLEGYVQLQAALRASSVPWTFVHPCTVIGASDSGEITQDTGLLKLVDALRKGRLTAVPGKARDWLPVVAVDYLAAFLAGVIERDDTAGQEYWVLDEGTPRLAELVGWLAEGLGQPAPRQRIPVWLLKFVLNAGLGKRWDMSAESLNFISAARYPTASARALAQDLGLAMPHTHTTVQRMVAYWRGTQAG